MNEAADASASTQFLTAGWFDSFMSLPRLGLAVADRRFCGRIAFRFTADPHPSRRTGIG
jgi:hypothetical protein